MHEIKVKWITDRLPTESDTDGWGHVVAPCDDYSHGWAYLDRGEVNLGDPWHPAFKVVEDEPEIPELDTSNLPDGWKAEYRGKGWTNNGNPCLYGYIIDSGHQKLNTEKRTPEGAKGFHYWELIPPAEVPWERPSDVPEDARWFRPGESEFLYAPLSFDSKGVYFSTFSDGRKAHYSWDDLQKYWKHSSRPFDKWEDGKPCTKKGGDQ